MYVPLTGMAAVSVAILSSANVNGTGGSETMGNAKGDGGCGLYGEKSERGCGGTGEKDEGNYCVNQHVSNPL